MARLALSPRRRVAREKRSKGKYCVDKTKDTETEEEGAGEERTPWSRRKRRLQPLAASSSSSSSASASAPCSSAATAAPERPTEKARRAFEAALLRRDFQHALWLIAAGEIAATHETHGGETALLAAIGARHEDAFRLVLQCSGVSIDDRNRHGSTPLMKAIAAAAPFAESTANAAKQPPLETKMKAAALLPSLRTHPSHADAATEDAAAFDNRMVACVLAHRPDLHARDAAGHTAFDWAARLRNHAALALLADHERRLRAQHADFADRGARRRECVALLRRHDAVATQMESLLREPLLQEAPLVQLVRGAPPELTHERVADALTDVAVLRGDDAVNDAAGESFVQDFFLDRETRDGWTPLTKAAACGFVDALQLLLARGADAAYESRRLRHTALTWASYCGHEGAALALLRLPRLRVDQQTREGKTALMHAVANRQLAVVRHLVRAMHERSVRRASGKETFHARERAAELESRRRPSRWGKRPVSSRKPGAEEWHELFLEMLLAQDRGGRDALRLADELDDAADDAADDTTRLIQRELRHAVAQARGHEAYVATHVARTAPTACTFARDGCDFVAPLDLLPAHERHECAQRRVDCERCGESVAADARASHDRAACAQRLVACANRQHGCALLVPAHESEAHARDHCRKRLVRCRLGCGAAALAFDARDAHEATQCPARLVECARACGAAPFAARASKHHAKTECAKRPVRCVAGCGRDVPLDHMDLHAATLCEKRRQPCTWARHGCAARIGDARRHHHEDAECPFRLVACRHSGGGGGCPATAMLACFAADHYAWQCSVEPKPCANACGVAAMPSHRMDAHAQREEAGDCAQRPTRCRLDLCGKTLTLYDTEPDHDDHGARLLTSDTAVAPLARVSMRGLRQRVQRTSDFVAKLRRRHDRHDDDRHDDDEHDDDKHDDDKHDEGDEGEDGHALFWRVAAARAALLAWLAPQLAALESELARVETAKRAAAARVRVLSFDGATQRHLLEFPRDGRAEWRALAGREYDVELPPDGASASFGCGLVAAGERTRHEHEDCALRLVACPLACGQRLTVQALAAHLARRCNQRNAACRLGCGTVLPFLSLAEHEDAQCEQRQVGCPHCHAAMAHRSVALHLDTSCPHVPRRCRFGCAARLPSCQFDAHEASECPKRLVACAACDTHVWHSELETHARDECALRVLGACDAGCGAVLRANARAHHSRVDCARRELPCPQCREVVTWDALAQHKALRCPLRHVVCRRGCGARLAARDRAAHEDGACAQRTVWCANKCGDALPFARLPEHLARECPLRVVACPHGCGDRLVAYQCEPHARRCRQRLCACGAGARHCARPVRLWLAQRRLVACSTHGETGLRWALKTLDEDLVAYFVQSLDPQDAASGVDGEFANGFSPLTTAASLGNLEIAKTLLRGGADVNGETSRGRTPLLEATLARDPAMVALLLEHRARVAHVNRHGQRVLAVAESFAAVEAAASQQNGTRAARVLALLQKQQKMDTDQRALFTAIACSDYEFVATLLKHSSGVAAATALLALEASVAAARTACAAVERELDESVALLNESIADTESKTTHATRLRERVDDGASQIAAIAASHEASVAESNALESEMLAAIRAITALDIAQLLNAHTPPAAALVVVKSICLLCGVMPRGRRHASEYTDLEWWKTAQALLMDRSLLSKLRGYRNQSITPDVMAKVRRECLRTAAFAAFEASTRTVENEQDDEEETPPVVSRRLPRRGDIVGILATWVHGVEIEYKAQSERQTLHDKKRRLAVSLSADARGLEAARFDMQVAARSLPARQNEVEAAKARVESHRRELAAARQRLRAFRLVQFAALNGHTPLSFACAVGNEAMVHVLLTHGASGGPLPEEREACAALVQLTFREFLFRRRQQQEKQQETKKSEELASRSDAAVAALVRSVAQTFLLGHYRRRRRQIQQTHRVPLHEAVYNGHAAIADILLAHGDAKLWHRTHIFPQRVVPGATAVVAAEPTSALALRRRGGWTLVPLTGSRGSQGAAPEMDAHELEQQLAPMFIEETLAHALHTFESRTFVRDAGGWRHDETRYGATAAFVGRAMAKLRETQEAQQREIRARKNVARKTREQQLLHAQLERAVVARDFGGISALLDAGAFADFETRGVDGLTALMAACVEETYVENCDGSRVLAAAFLLDRAANRPFADFESSTGRTALLVAARHGTPLCAQELLDRGARVNLATRTRGETALMVAARHGQAAFVEYLLRHSETDVFVSDRAGRTALDHAKEGGSVDVQRALGAAMGGGTRGRVFASESALYGVCKWGCGVMAATEGHAVGENGVVLAATHPLDAHERETCPKRIVACPLGCGGGGADPPLWAESVETHVRCECPLRVVVCAQPKCGARVVARDLPEHDAQHCDLRVVTCECGERMTHLKHVLHARNTCAMRLVPCPNQCLGSGGDGGVNVVTLVRHCELKAHDRSACAHRRVRCRNGCVATALLAKDRELHETALCVLRRVHCQWGCSETVLATAQRHHEADECLLRELRCPNKCGATVAVAALDEHLQTQCARRAAPCTLGCGRKVPLHTMATHAQSECRRRVVACAQCGEALPELELESHRARQCALRLAACGLCGAGAIAASEMETHRRDACRMRVAACRFQCYAARPLLAHEKLHHEQFECANRPVFCPLGCGETLVAHAAKKHERVCDMRIVACGHGCGVELREKERREHELRYCAAKGPFASLQRGKK